MDPDDTSKSMEISVKGSRLLPGPFRFIAANLARERENWPLWLPVGLGFGIAIYFLLAVEPPL